MHTVYNLFMHTVYNLFMHTVYNLFMHTVYNLAAFELRLARGVQRTTGQKVLVFKIIVTCLCFHTKARILMSPSIFSQLSSST